jgi:hypothetical protein
MPNRVTHGVIDVIMVGSAVRMSASLCEQQHSGGTLPHNLRDDNTPVL